MKIIAISNKPIINKVVSYSHLKDLSLFIIIVNMRNRINTNLLSKLNMECL